MRTSFGNCNNTRMCNNNNMNKQIYTFEVVLQLKYLKKTRYRRVRGKVGKKLNK